jgi:orotate phosphoribosyltransferase
MSLGVEFKKLENYIRKNCIEYGKFTLKSGIESNVYVDCKKLLLSSYLYLTTINLSKILNDFAFNSIGGPEVGVIPLIGSFITYKKSVSGIEYNGFVVRKEEKTHGKSDIVIGCIERGDRCVVIEDTTTTGRSLYRAVEEVEKLDCKVIQAVTIIDREMGAKELFEKRNIPFSALYTLSDLTKD